MKFSFPKLFFCVVAAVAACGPGASAQLVINEVMQSNVDCLLVDKEFPDSYVELYNPSSSAVAINGYRLATEADGSDAYTFRTGESVPAGGFIVIYCDKSDAGGRHTKFRIDSGKGSVVLFGPSGSVADKIDLKKQPAPQIAYGRSADGGSEWGYMVTPTPGQSNSLSAVAQGLLPAPEFSVGGGLKKGSVSLVVSAPADAPADVRLCLTTDGREPVAGDWVGGTSKSLTLTTSTVVRAKLMSASALTIPSTVHSYIFHPEDTELPVFSIAVNPSYLYDETIGIFRGEVDHNPNFEKNWRRPMNVEFFDGADHKELINQLGEARVMGGWSRREAQKSLAFYANKRFGTKRYDSTTFWPDKPEITEVKSFVLRNGGNDFTNAHIRDAMAQTISGRNSPHVDWQAYRPAIVYINGRYHGIMDIRERSNEDYVLANYGTEDIDMVENWWDVKAGSKQPLDEFVAVAARSGVTLAQMKEHMDVDNFIDMFVIETMSANTDFPGNNITCWKGHEPESRWRWVLKDLDRMGMTWIDSRTDFFKWIADFHRDNAWLTDQMKVFTFFFDNEDGRKLFVDRMAIALGDYLQQANAEALRDEMKAELEPEYWRHEQRWFDEHPEWWWWQHWHDELSYITKWWQERRTYLYSSMVSRFGLSPTFALKIERNGHDATFNDVALTQPRFDGSWFGNRKMTLTTEHGYMWEFTKVYTNNSTSTGSSASPDLSLTISDKSVKELRLAIVRDAAGLSDAAAPDVEFMIDGLTVTAVGEAGLTEAYTAAGRLVGRASAGSPLTLPGAGIYLLRHISEATGAVTTEKVAVR